MAKKAYTSSEKSVSEGLHTNNAQVPTFENKSAKPGTLLIDALVCVASVFVLFEAVFFLGTHPTVIAGNLFQAAANAVFVAVDNVVFRDFLIYGVITGIGGLFVYIPNIMVMFLIVNILVNANLHWRIGRLLHPLLKRVGLAGHSVVPMTFGFGCTVNSMQGAQQIPSPGVRLRTLFVAPFMSCGSKVSVYILLIASTFPFYSRGPILFSLYMGGFIVGIATTSLLSMVMPQNTTKAQQVYTTDTGLPSVRMPDIASTVKKTLGDTWVFIRTAGVVILLASMCIWGLSYFPGVSVEEYTAMQERAASQGEQLPPRRTLSLHTSYMARVAEALSPIFKPLGFDWRTTVAVLAGFTGRGAVIATLNTFYGIEGGPEKSDVLTDALKKSAFYNSATVVSLMVFVLLSGSCLAGIAMFYHYVKSAWMTILFVAYPVTLAWIAAAIAYRIVPFLGIK